MISNHKKFYFTIFEEINLSRAIKFEILQRLLVNMDELKGENFVELDYMYHFNY